MAENPRVSSPRESGVSPNRIILGDNLPVLQRLEARSVQLIYIDPPFNTGRTQRLDRIQVTEDSEAGDRTGFQGKRYRTRLVGSQQYPDQIEDYARFLEPRLIEARRVLSPDGSLFLHLDYREAHYAKVLLDQLWGRACFINEIIWAYDYGGRSKRRWPAKHDTILWYANDPADYLFNYAEIDRIPYMAPGLVGEEKAARGKTPTDVWWHTIVPTRSAERTGYPTQKPLGILERIVKVHSRPDDWVLDFFAGSGTTGEAAARLARRFILIDSSPQAVEIMRTRLAFAEPVIEGAPATDR